MVSGDFPDKSTVLQKWGTKGLLAKIKQNIFSITDFGIFRKSVFCYLKYFLKFRCPFTLAQFKQVKEIFQNRVSFRVVNSKYM